MIFSKQEILSRIASGVSFQKISNSPEYSEFVKFLKFTFQTTLREALYLYCNDIQHKPICSCGSPKKFKSFEFGYGDDCGNVNCGVRKKIIKEKRTRTNIEKYGVENPFSNKGVQERIRKTNLEKYGVENPSSAESIKRKKIETSIARYGVGCHLQSDIVKSKSNRTILQRYGCEHPMQSGVIKDKIRETNLDRYGCEHPMQSNGVKHKTRETNLSRYGVGCSLHSESVRKKVVSTNLERYGVEHPMQSDIVKGRVKSYNVAIYGTEHPMQNVDVKNKTRETNLSRYGVHSTLMVEYVKRKIASTVFERYGVSHQSQSKEFRESYKRTAMERYGVENPMKSDLVKERFKLVLWQNYYSLNKDLLKFTPQNPSVPLKEGDPIEWKCCGHVSEYIDYNGPMSARCPICDKSVYGTSSGEIELIDFITSVYSGEIRHRDRSLIKPKELDIYIPDRNLAIEYNGVYWHSSGSIEEDQFFETRHYNKTLLCGERGINLFHVSEFDWQNVQKKEIIKSMIRHKLKKNTKIHARKTEVREVSPSDSREFLERNHLQGNVNGSKVNIGLYHNNKLVSLMTFGKPRFNKNFEWELLRFCNDLNMSVVGGASKLLKHFRKLESGSIISYANRDHSLGTLYQNLGFELISESSPSYVWHYNNKKYSRYETQKHKLKNLLGDGFDENLTEAENMYKNGFRRVFDSGNWVFGLM